MTSEVTNTANTRRESIETMNAIQLSDALTSQEEFYCVNCFEFLWPPIMLGKKGNICGNCWENDSDEFIPNVALEKTLQNLSIRCINSDNGCKVRKDYKKMAMHSQQCIYRYFRCPKNLVDRCGWMGYFNKLVNHFSQEHPQNILKSEINSVSLSINITEQVKQIKLLMLPGGNFVSLISTDIVNQKLSFAVFFIEDYKLKANDCQFVVQLNNSKNSSIIHKTSKYNIVDISNYSEDYNDGLKLDTDLLQKFSTNGLYECTLKITSNLFGKKISEEELQNFECPVCNNYMRAPIYQCLDGHSICKECKPKLNNCPMCRSGFGNTRNYTLENLSNGFHFPCSNQVRGCEQYFLPKDIVIHEGDCRFKSYICPFAFVLAYCKWTGSLANLYDHLINVHLNFLYMTDQGILTVPFCLQQQFRQTYCLMIYGKIFKVSYKNDDPDQIAYWDVQLVGPKSKCKEYSYKVIVINEENLQRKLTVLNLCQEFTNNESIFNNSCVKLPFNVLSDYLNGDKLTFLVKIVKKGI